MKQRERLRFWKMALVLCLPCLFLPAVSWADRTPQANYILRCAGCHALDGTGHIPGGIPPFPGFISHIVNDDDGRTYVMHVPGVVASSLSDNEIAAVLNYVAERWGGVPFVPFDAEEVARRKLVPVKDLVAFRRELVSKLGKQGVELAAYPWP